MSRDVYLKKLIYQTLDDQLDKMKKNRKDEQSFLYLEGESIHLLLTLLLLNMDAPVEESQLKQVEDKDINQILNNLDQMIVNKRQSYNKILQELGVERI
ncbi:hypothetical protein [Aquisalibacillus elongatus]|uniref:Uncharacterized protein n=1 Tax=Aquisalibacillus elongatus TaxID=485577 RepID=A0A3N5C2B4_9BACI|nr:hypothetical protein [Aquisalibacillus elongatus]RPF52155.1 hypothetical protein EDC24_2145 [Aquisalibacillus elongatus]